VWWVCWGPRYVPVADRMLGQMIAITVDEDTFLIQACVWKTVTMRPTWVRGEDGD
jgi:hypothetical protein